jgi:hypothetical protein
MKHYQLQHREEGTNRWVYFRKTKSEFQEEFSDLVSPETSILFKNNRVIFKNKSDTVKFKNECEDIYPIHSFRVVTVD